MDPRESFGGTAGEVVRGFVRPGTLLTTIPVIVVTMVLGLISAAIVDLLGLPAVAAVFVLLVTASPVVGRFALPAREGDLTAGFVESRFDGGDLFAFVVRYAALTLAWGVPAAVLFLILAPSLVGAAVGGVGALLLGPSAIVFVAAFVVVLLAPTLSVLVATRTDSVGEALSADAWRWLFLDRRHDLVAFYSSLVGGLFLFVLMAVPLLLVLAAAAVAVAPMAAGMLAVLAWLAPTAASPVLLGRLAGAFALAEEASGGREGAHVQRAPEGSIRTAGAGSGSRRPAGVAGNGVLDLGRSRRTRGGAGA